MLWCDICESLSSLCAACCNILYKAWALIVWKVDTCTLIWIIWRVFYITGLQGERGEKGGARRGGGVSFSIDSQSQPALVPNKPTPRHRYIQMRFVRSKPKQPLKGSDQNIEFVDNAPGALSIHPQLARGSHRCTGTWFQFWSHSAAAFFRWQNFDRHAFDKTRRRVFVVDRR